MGISNINIQYSIFDNQTQSWKLDIDDGRLYFYWANDEEFIFKIM